MLTLSPSTTSLPSNGIREIVNLAMARPTGSIVRLEQGEPSFTPPAHVRDAAIRAVEQRSGYTQSLGTMALREAITYRLNRDYDMNVAVPDIAVTQGAVEAIFLALTAVVRAGDEVLVPDPAWPTYEMQVLALGARPIRYRLKPQNGYLPDLEEIRSLSGSATRAIILNSPSNPTGSVIDADLLQRIVEFAAAADMLVISDEVYDQIIFDGEHVTARQFAPESVVSVFSFSKTYSMTGWRVGYAVVPEWMRVASNRIQETVLSCISEVSQHAAVAALQGPQDSVAENLLAYRERRDLAVGLLSKQRIKTVMPQGAFYLLVPLAPGADSRAAALQLVERGVGVAPGTAFGASASDQIRLSLASSPADLQTGIGRIVEWCAATNAGRR